MKITQGFIKKLTPRDRRYSITDSNLEARVEPTGRISLNFLYWSADKRRRIPIVRLLNNKVSRDDAQAFDIKYQKLLTKRSQFGDIQSASEKGIKRRQEVSSQTLRHASEEYLKWYKENRLTFKNERLWHEKICNYLGNLDPREITAQDLQYVIDHCQGDRTDRTYKTTQHHVGKAIVRFWKWLKRKGYIDSREVALDLEKPKMRKRNRLYSDEELVAFTTAQGDDIPHPAIICAAYCPMRASELMRLNWDEFSGDRKNGGWQEVLVKSEAEEEHIVRFFLTPSFMKNVPSDSGYFFMGRHGRKVLLSNSLAESFRKRRERLDIGQHGDGVHTFRKNLGTWAQINGIPNEHWQSCLGHTVGGLTGTYGLYQYAEEKKDVWIRWSKHLDQLRKG